MYLFIKKSFWCDVDSSWLNLKKYFSIDIAIGAPYENDNRGAVYIYNGGKSGISGQPSQIIHAKDISLNLRGFGISFSNVADIDKNGINGK